MQNGQGLFSSPHYSEPGCEKAIGLVGCYLNCLVGLLWRGNTMEHSRTSRREKGAKTIIKLHHTGKKGIKKE